MPADTGWRHVPAELPKSKHDPKPVWCAFCGSLDAPWPCDAEQMRLRAEAAEAALRDAPFPRAALTSEATE